MGLKARQSCLLGLVIALCAAATAQEAKLVVHTQSGWVRGVIEGNIRAFRAIPFAAPPLGDLRWRPPQPPIPWSGIRDASSFTSKCVQIAFGGILTGNEDCLVLNVFTSSDLKQEEDEGGEDDGQPVMVFFHGGGNQRGSSQAPLFDDPGFAAHGVVAVTAEYRLNALGFFAHPLLTAEGGGSSGNYGLMDQIAALRWVKHNIQAFGGDQGRVMVFGQSSGGVDVESILTSPAARGLFSRAGIESAGFLAGETATLAQLETIDAPLVALVGCDKAADVLACMRGIPADVLVTVTNQNALLMAGAIEPRVLPVDPFVVLERYGSPVPLLIGSTREESTGIVDDATMPLDVNQYIATVHSEFDSFGPGVADKVLSFYPVSAYDSPIYALIAVDSDFAITCAARDVARVALGESPVWRYLFTHRVENDPYLNAQRAFHTEELYFLFGHPDYLATPSADEIELSNLLINYWTRFAASGDPNGPDDPHWRRYGHADHILQLDEPTKTITGYHNPQCDYFTTLLSP